MPLLYVNFDDCQKERGDIVEVLDESHASEKEDAILNVANRLKPMDCVKVLMGIQSNKECVKRFAWKSSLWARLQEYDFEGVLTLAE